jgi:hypothetical protein
MIFPGLSRSFVPLLGAGQPAASASPPPDSFRCGPRPGPEGQRPPKIIRVRVLITAAGTPHLQPDLRRSAMSGAVTRPAGSRRGPLSLRHHPKSLHGPSRCPRPWPVVTPRWRASGPKGLANGPRKPRRSLPGHKAHHRARPTVRHPKRSQQQLRSRRSDVAERNRQDPGRSAVRNDLRRRRSAASKRASRSSLTCEPHAREPPAPERTGAIGAVAGRAHYRDGLLNRERLRRIPPASVSRSTTLVKAGHRDR